MKPASTKSPRSARCPVLLLALAGTFTAQLPATAHAADIVVRISGVAEPLGRIGCSLFAGAHGFPMDNSSARVLWLPARAEGVTCRFSDIAESTYAVSIGHDLNDNKRVDTNFIGVPTEQWGVSNNARPSLRSPRFDEAAFRLPADVEELVIDIEVAR